MRARETDGFNSPRLVAMGRELKRLMELQVLPWPHNLYGPAMMSQSLQQQKPRNEAQCICGKDHRQNIPWTRKSLYGNGFSVAYFCSSTCKSRAARENG